MSHGGVLSSVAIIRSEGSFDSGVIVGEIGKEASDLRHAPFVEVRRVS